MKMQNREYNKQCNATDLDAELRAAGFDIFGVSNSGALTVVHLKDGERKDPTLVVNAHVFKAPLTNEQIRAKDKLDFDNASTAEQKLAILAKRAGL